MANVTFNASALSLSPSTDYWLVLKAPSGEFAWGWTSDSAYTAGWGNSSDSGASWFTDDAFPLQFSVSASAVPEPSPAWTAAVFVSALLVRRRRNETLSSREES
jgi:MYXO-CTERM domain-containing protein